MIKGIFTVKRILLLLLLMIIGATWYVSQNIHPISIKVLNKLLSPYDIQVLNLDTQLVSINQLRIPRLILQIEDSYISIQGFELTLTDTLAIAKKQQLDPSDIVKLSSKSVYVDLGASFFNRQTQQQTESSAAWQLVFNHIPDIDLGETIIRLPALPAAGPELTTANGVVTHFRHSLKMDTFTLNPQGALSTLWRFDDNELFNVNAQIMPTQLHLSTKLNLKQSQLGLNALSDYLTAAITSLKAKRSEQETYGMIVGIQQQLATVLAPLKQYQIDIDGNWHADTQINLTNNEIYSVNHFIALKVESQKFEHLAFNVPDDFKIEVDVKQQPVPAGINQGAQNIFAAKIDIAPFEQQISFNQLQLSQLLKQLFADNIASQLNAFIDGLKVDSRDATSQIGLLVSVPKPSLLWLPLAALETNEHSNNNTSAVVPVSFFTPEIIASVSGGIIDNTFRLTDVQVNDLGEIHIAPSVELDITQAVDMVKLFAPLTEFPLALTLPFNEFTLSKARVTFEAEFERLLNKHNNSEQHTLNKDFTDKLIIMPSSQILMSQLYVNKNNSALESTIAQTSSQSFTSTEMSIQFHQQSKFESTTGYTQLTLAPLQLELQKVNAVAIDSIGKKQSLSAKSAQFDWLPSTHFTWQVNTTNSLIDQFLAQSSQYQISSQLDHIKLSQTLPKQRKQALLNLGHVSLKQQTSVDKGLIQSQEQWQFDNINATSKHFFQPKSQSLAGQWLLETDISQALPTIGKNQPIAPGLNIAGRVKVASSYSMREQDGIQYFEMLIQPQLTDLNLDYIDYYISDSWINTQCQFNWQQHIEDSISTSQLICPETNINIAKGRAGLLFSNLNLQANIELNMDPTKPLNNWLQKLTGLSETDIKMTLRGDALGGQFLVPEFVFKLHDKSHGYLLLQGLSLKQLLEQQPQVGVHADGIFDGVLPAEFINGELTITGGHIAARQPGGLIKVDNNEAIEQLKQSQPYLNLVFGALEHLNYQQLSGKVAMHSNGDAQINVAIKGKSLDIARPIHLNYTHEENLIQLYRSTQIGNQLQSNIEKSVK
ncbi:YdbH domain-containing protein [Shewanella sp. HL-SH5]|uniref:YdbH domain-containing protein n=1 Tax=Shewanella sp. HL-SH5 TaxID=3436241 RepID=UPI003EC006CB